MELRSPDPVLVRQEVWGLLLAHYAVRGLMHEAALQAEEDPERLSFLHTVRVIRRQLPRFPPWRRAGLHRDGLDEILQERLQSSRNRHNPRGVKRKLSRNPVRSRAYAPTNTV
jgi:hypothetical protein